MNSKKIKRIELIEDNTNYYDLSVEGTHNYCLSNGMVVHNTGVGFSVQSNHIDLLPEIHKPTKHKRYLIADSIEGWADAVKELIYAYLKGKALPIFDFSDIRAKGERLVTAGGKAPGPAPLKTCLVNIQNILDEVPDGQKLKPIQVHDIICHIADSVLAGGIRRSALISLFDFDDLEMRSAKSGDYWELHPHRGRANNSAVINRNKISKDDFEHFWEIIKNGGTGEPGIFFTSDSSYGTNPCISGDAMISVKEEGGSPFEIKMSELVELCHEKTLYTLSFNESSETTEWKEITGGQCTQKNAELVQIECNGKTVKCTPDHKILTANRGWVAANALEVTDQLIGAIAGTGLMVRKLDLVEDVYDISVKDNHNFFANDICVHNCAEVALKSDTTGGQFCNLVTINMDSVTSQEDFEARVRAATTIGTIQASYTDFHYLREGWKKITEKEALLGVSMTGIASNNIKKLNLNLKKAVKEQSVAVNKEVAKLIGIKSSARITLIKPDGTSSIVLGTASGVHAWYNDYYVRRIRLGKNEAIYQYLSQFLTPEFLDDEYFRPNEQAVLTIPVKAPKDAILRNESPIDLLERVRYIYDNWILPGHVKGVNTHNTSVTVSIKDNEWDSVGEWLWENKSKYTGVSVLPYDGGNYIQAPFEDITEEEYTRLSEKLNCLLNENNFSLDNIVELSDTTNLSGEIACGGGSCEVSYL